MKQLEPASRPLPHGAMSAVRAVTPAMREAIRPLSRDVSGSRRLPTVPAVEDPALAACAVLGTFAVGYPGWLRGERRRLRLAKPAAARSRRPGMLRRRRARLPAMVEGAVRAEAARGGDA